MKLIDEGLLRLGCWVILSALHVAAGFSVFSGPVATDEFIVFVALSIAFQAFCVWMFWPLARPFGDRGLS